MSKLDLIDVHHHAIPPSYGQALRGNVPIPNVDYPTWTPEDSLEVMDATGIAASVLSITAPGLCFNRDPDFGRRMAREVNEYYAELIERHPGRFGAFALLPLPHIEAARDELAYAIDNLGLDGVGLLTSYHDRYLGAPEFEPLLAEIAERGIPVHVHPMIPPAADVVNFDLPPSLYDFTFETTRTVVSLLFNGVLDRLPDLRMILSHAGGTIPFLAKRLTYGPTIGAYLKDRQPKDLIGSLRGLYYDIAMSANEFTLPALDSLVDADHVLFGSDFPFMPDTHTKENIAGFENYPGWNAEQRRLIGRDNALRLFAGLAERVAAAEGKH